MNRRAKIICTLGPAVDGVDQLEKLIIAGMDVARLNFSHGAHADHEVRYRSLREAAARVGKQVAILQDLCGVKIRTGVFDGGAPEARLEEEVWLSSGKSSKYPEIAIQTEGFAGHLVAGDKILLDDGRVELRVTGPDSTRVRCVVELAGPLRDRVGVHLPARSVQGGALTSKDREDLAFGLALGVDFVAVSFVRRPEDLIEATEACRALGREVPLVSKIETPMAIDQLDAVVAASDALMVARGDLGVEYSPEAVPVLQRRIIRAARLQHKPVIVATEMLQSMVHSTRPTRAEANDVANAVFGDADAVMLSAESATGDYPVLAVEMMAKIVMEAERAGSDFRRPGTAAHGSIEESLVFNAADIADEIGAKALVAYTTSGVTGRLASTARPAVPLVVFSPSAEVCRRMAICWGTLPHAVEQLETPDNMVDYANAHLLASGLVKPGETFVAVFGSPVTANSRTNTIRVRVAG